MLVPRPRALCVILMMMCFMHGFVSWLNVVLLTVLSLFALSM